MGGPEHQSTGVSAQLSRTFQATPRCPERPARLTPIRLDRGLWLRSTKQEVVAALGSPSYRLAGWLSFDFAGKSPQKCADGFCDVTNALQLRMDHGFVIDLRASQVSSC